MDHTKKGIVIIRMNSQHNFINIPLEKIIQIEVNKFLFLYLAVTIIYNYQHDVLTFMFVANFYCSTDCTDKL